MGEVKWSVSGKITDSVSPLFAKTSRKLIYETSIAPRWKNGNNVLDRMNAGLSLLCLALLFIVSARTMADFVNIPRREGINKFKSPEPEEDETKVWMQTYLEQNGISTSTVLKVGMEFKEFVKVLGEPTGRYRWENGDWAIWHHNPPLTIAREIPPIGERSKLRMHAAPWIKVRIENGVVKELSANRN